MTHLVVLCAIMVCMLFALVAQVLLQSWVHEKLLSYRVAGKLSCELVAESCLVVNVVRVVNNLVVVLL
jgi:hypothetical protein